MRTRFCNLFLFIVLLLPMMQSCGSGGEGASGDAVVLTTSLVAANANPSSIDADISPDTATGTIHKDTVSVSIVSTSTVASGTIALPVQVNSVTVSYVAKNGGPPLANETYNINTTVAAGGTQTFAIDAATLNQKRDVILPAFTGTPTTFDYDVTLTFNVSEVGFGGRSGSPITHTFIHFANFADS